MEKKRSGRTFRQTIRLTGRFVPYFKPYWKMLVLDLLCAALTSACELVLPLIMSYITDLGSRDIALITLSTIGKVGGLYLALRLVDTAAYFYQINRGHVMGSMIESDLRRDLFGHLQKLSNTYYDNTKIGQLMSRITTDLNDVTEFAHHFPEEVFVAAIKIGVSFGVLLTRNVPLTLIIYLAIPLMILSASRFNLQVRSTLRQSRSQLGELNAQVEDSLLGIRVVKAFSAEKKEEEKFNRGNRAFLSIRKDIYKWLALFHCTTRMFDGLMHLLILVLGALFIRAGKITVPDMVAYIMYVNMLLASVRRIVEFSEQFQRGITGIERFVEVMDEPVEIHDAPGARRMEKAQGRVTFDHVSFSYKGGKSRVLTNINLDVPAGQSIALVGPSGGGKTTLCSLIPRFYQADEGRILLDGQDINQITLDSLRSQIGIVQQDVFLFSGTIRDNIEYGKPGASFEEIVQAAKQAGAHEFILKLEKGYDTWVGERGVKLSGGQKQRVSIARVFLKNPPVLILDEATSALDNESEALIQKSLDRLMKGRTTFTIAHRLSTIRGADCILVLTDEGIVEKGDHRQLMEKKGIYYHLQKNCATVEQEGTLD